MKRFLPLLILAGLLFGQDVLYLKSGEYKKGTCIEKVGNDIVFQVEGENIYTKFSIDLVEIIETNNRKYYYPFDIPTKIDISTKKEGNELAPIVLQFLFNPTPSERLLQNCMAIPCGFIMFIIAIALNPGSDS
jgi:hypothetical protein